MPAGDPLPAAKTVAELFQLTARAHRDRVAVRSSDGRVEFTWGQYAERVERIATGLAALGVRRGDTVALMLTNRPEFHLVDTAVLHLGATPFSVYATSPPSQIAFLFANAGNRLVVTEKQWVDTVRAAGATQVVCAGRPVEGTVSLADVEAMRPERFDFAATWRSVQPGDLLTIIYTSGTTGQPKGVELEHRAMLASLRGGLDLDFVAAGARGGRLVSYLPDAHVANRYFSHYLAMAGGASITTVADPKTIAAVLPAVRPTVFLGVPAFWQKMQKAISATGGVRGRVVRWALAQRQAGLRHAVADRLVLRTLRARLGLADATAVITGAAPIAPGVVRFFLALGIRLCEGWAMSESAAGGTIGRPGSVRPGTVGTPMRTIEVKAAGDGELLLRGPTLMRGYRGDPVRTAEAFDAEGWLRTGDVGVIGADGYVTIVDRKKDLIINASGKNMAPAGIEHAVLASCPLVASAAAIGDGRPYVVMLLTLDPDAARDFAVAQGISPDLAALAADPIVQEEVGRGITRANGLLSRVEQVKYFRVLPDSWVPGSEELTPTGKLRRRAIAAKYADEIEALYR
ncbi:AMP-dependent synthetase/ligase [Amycolatopsis jejuensis]|uniref:AMP-dependent synthetase/ligase n=1 Tax=Amycolatopsis jejuensis TaxID=330084 RepID=UPI000524C30D|nr:AMP-dependent synthetase/ligase [Amycolatopsis jejuensis]